MLFKLLEAALQCFLCVSFFYNCLTFPFTLLDLTPPLSSHTSRACGHKWNDKDNVCKRSFLIPYKEMYQLNKWWETNVWQWLYLTKEGEYISIWTVSVVYVIQIDHWSGAVIYVVFSFKLHLYACPYSAKLTFLSKCFIL